MSRGALVAAAVTLAVAGCGVATLGIAPSLDVGSYEVSEADPGIGMHLEVGGYGTAGATGFGVVGSAGMLGYTSSGDGDPIVLIALEGRYRRMLGSSIGTGAYLALGAGAGMAAVAGPRSLAVPLGAELGYQFTSGSLLATLGLRERPTLLYSGGSPPFDVVSSTQLLVGLGVALRR